MKRRFDQLDVFSAQPLKGNPLAVVHGADGLDEATMAAFARWTNLSETTFLLPPDDPAADYRVRIFTPFAELPFAGHPTLGSAWAWLAAGGRPRESGSVVQQCGVGLVRLRRDGARLAFAAPPLRRSGPLEETLLARIARGLGVPAGGILHHQWVDNGPGWCAVMLGSGAAVRALQPDWALLKDLKLGIVGAQRDGEDTAFEVRALVGPGGFEDPVTGSLNASLAQWMIGAGLAPSSYVAAQGHALQRAGRVHVHAEAGTVWVGGDVAACIGGEVDL
ncbi:PhzF family phenazine biosynthesis protein [Pseudorhodoferax sp.]|uniref:PhzF family phenazine biosynthesis protein n=1 Tax=Pseudorhodoferax sp. TaxID=1993553 RepID=UPI002DD695DE|nr:PhzF family phenazine biosynthesis protein [Pseudorhodoferax sp.]